MINFNYEVDFILTNPSHFTDWITAAINEEGCSLDEINYIFCSDSYLHKLNIDFLKHDTLTDILSFDNSVGKQLSGDIFISIDRVKDNAHDFNALFYDELARVIIHGVLHFCGFKDKTEQEISQMRLKENYYLSKL